MDFLTADEVESSHTPLILWRYETNRCLCSSTVLFSHMVIKLVVYYYTVIIFLLSVTNMKQYRTCMTDKAYTVHDLPVRKPLKRNYNVESTKGSF